MSDRSSSWTSCMGCCSSRPYSPQNNESTSRWEDRASSSFDLLLLGTEGCGKSTFLRQMQYIHGTGFNDVERRDFIRDINGNIFHDMEILINQMTELAIDYSSPNSEDLIQAFKSEESSDNIRLQATRLLWEDEGIQVCFQRRAEYEDKQRLNTSAKYFLDAIERISEVNYLPIENDIIRVRRETTDVRNYFFRVRDVDFKITDIGGGVRNRLSWAQVLQETVTCVIYFVAMDEYDSYYIPEGEGRLQNRLRESINIFREIQANRWLPHTTFILFLNKIDLFVEKRGNSRIDNHFPEYENEGMEIGDEDGRSFIRNKFIDLRARGRFIYPHYTQATDPENIRVVFYAVRDSILQMNLRFYNLL